MQPLGRPVARAAWAHGCRLLVPELAALAPRAASRGIRTPASCLRQAIAARARLYSSQPPQPPQPTSGEAGKGRDRETQSTNSAAAQPRTRNDASHPSSSELPSAVDRRRSALNQGFSQVIDNLQSRVLTASHTLNDITGYSAIEAIKAENGSLEAQLAEAQCRVRIARQAYKTSNTKRATTQREVTTLLARKDSWSPADLERFTELYRTDHVLEGEVTGAQEALTDAEAQEQSLSQRLNAGILKRYHEEQIWSDRIRRASTWGTWGIMGMNFVLFVVLQFVAEPWRRRRLVKGVVEEEKAVLQEVRSELEAVRLGLEKRAQADEPLQTGPEADGVKAALDVRDVVSKGTWQQILTDPTRWKTAAADLCSERRVELRMRDASMLAFEGALAGAALAGGLALLLTRRA